MYLLFKSVSQRDMGIVQRVGSWMNYIIGYLPDTHKDIFDYRTLNAKVLDEPVAKAWMFIGAYRNYISVRVSTPQNESLQVVSSEEALGTKGKYNLTEDDKANTIALMKEVMRMILDEVYDKRMIELKANVSSLEFNSWEQQKTEAYAYQANNTAATPMLSSLATARGITLDEMVSKVITAVESYNASIAELLARKQLIETEVKGCASIADCCRLMHNRFEVTVSAAQAADEGITEPAKFDI